jgi:hypothetical protein
MTVIITTEYERDDSPSWSLWQLRSPIEGQFTITRSLYGENPSDRKRQRLDYDQWENEFPEEIPKEVVLDFIEEISRLSFLKNRE